MLSSAGGGIFAPRITRGLGRCAGTCPRVSPRAVSGWFDGGELMTGRLIDGVEVTTGLNVTPLLLPETALSLSRDRSVNVGVVVCTYTCATLDGNCCSVAYASDTTPLLLLLLEVDDVVLVATASLTFAASVTGGITVAKSVGVSSCTEGDGVTCTVDASSESSTMRTEGRNSLITRRCCWCWCCRWRWRWRGRGGDGVGAMRKRGRRC